MFWCFFFFFGAASISLILNLRKIFPQNLFQKSSNPKVFVKYFTFFLSIYKIRILPQYYFFENDLCLRLLYLAFTHVLVLLVQWKKADVFVSSYSPTTLTLLWQSRKMRKLFGDCNRYASSDIHLNFIMINEKKLMQHNS